MNILMVCAGNICRSPLAEGIMAQKIAKCALTGWKLDSAGTENYNIGNPPDSRSIEVALKRGLDIGALRARQLCADDFAIFDRIYVMDSWNYQEAKRIAGNKNKHLLHKLDLIMNEVYADQNRAVPDPYYGGIKGFERVYDMLEVACQAIATKYGNRV